MKKSNFILFLIAFSFISLSTIAQSSNPLVISAPKFTQGFLILDGSRTDIDYWRIFISERTFDENGFWNDKIIDRVELWNKNYFKIPSQYFVETAEHEYMYSVEGWSSTVGKVDETIPASTIGEGSPWLLGNTYVCNGTTYSWAIQQTIHPDDPGVYQYALTSATDFLSEPNLAFPFGAYVPYYEYMYISDYHIANDNSTWMAYHGLTNNSDLIPHNTLGHKVINAPSIYNAPDYTNSIWEMLIPEIGGPIVGVQKTMGPWKGISPSTGPTYIDWSDRPIMGTGSIVQLFNFHSNIQDYLDAQQTDQLLTCVAGAAISLSGWGNNQDNSWNDACFDAIAVPEDTNGDGIPELDQTLQTWYDCIQLSIAGTIAAIEVATWNDGESKLLTHLSHDEIFDALGQFNLSAFAIPQGLASITTFLESGKRATLFVDLKANAMFSIPLSSLINFTIFPVPLLGNLYTINVNSSATLDFKYEVMDMQGAIHFSSTYSILKDHHANHAVELKPDTPSGILIHRFTFADGSVQTITTTKQ